MKITTWQISERTQHNDLRTNSAKKSKDGKDEISVEEDGIRTIESHSNWLLRDISRAINKTLKHDVAESYRGFNGGCCNRPAELIFNNEPVKVDVDYLIHVDLRYTNVPWHGKGDILKYEDPQLNIDSGAADKRMALVYGPECQDNDEENPSVEPVLGGAVKETTSSFGWGT